MTTQTEEPAPTCNVMGCGLTRREHLEKNHEFNTDGNLIPVRKAPPRRPGVDGNSNVFIAGMITRLLAVLMKKGVLDEFDLSIITGGSDKRPPDRTENLQHGGSG